MRNLLCLVVGLISLTSTSPAQILTQNFGSGANVFSMNFVPITSAGNSPDSNTSSWYSSPTGSVGYAYYMGKYEISRSMVEKVNSDGALGITLQDMSSYGGNGANKPATGIGWYEAALFTNWLNTSQGYAPAYNFASGSFALWTPSDAGYNSSNRFRNTLARYVLPTRDEWYKAAFYNPSTSTYSYAPDGTNYMPKAVASGTDPNTAVWNNNSRGPGGPADITLAGGLSPFGVMGLGGNAQEWSESFALGVDANNPSSLRSVWGGSWDSARITSLDELSGMPSSELYNTGFRIVALSIPEPSSFSLVLIGMAGVAYRRLLKRRG